MRHVASSGMSHEEVVGEVVDHLRLPLEVVCKRVWQTFVARLVARFTLQPRGNSAFLYKCANNTNRQGPHSKQNT